MTKFERILSALTLIFLLLLGAAILRESRGLPLSEAAALPARTAAVPWLETLNTADAQALCALPGVGETIAGRIIAHREAHGPFRSPEELLEVEGIGEKTLENIYAYMEEN